MKLLAISWVVSDRAHGGEAIGSYELVKHLAQRGVDVDLVTPLYDVAEPLPKNVRVFPVKGGPRKGNTGANKAAMLRQVRRLERESPPDVTHVISQFTPWPITRHPFVMSGCYVFDTAGPGAIPLPVRLRRLVRDVRRGPALDVSRDLAFAAWHQWLGGWRFSRTVSRSDAILVRQSLGLEVYRAHARRAEYIPFGVDPMRFPPGPETREPALLFAGSLVGYKNVDGLLHAFARVAAANPEARLRIVGAGPEERALRELSRRLGVDPRVDFLGHLSREALSEEYRRASVFVLPSRGESFGQVCLEALCSATPVVASDRIAGAHDYIRPGENGLLVPPEEPGRIAEAVLGLLEDPAAARRMGRAGPPIAQRFAWSSIAERHLEVYRELAP